MPKNKNNKRNVPLCIPNIGKTEERAVLEVLRSGWFVHGPKNTELEERFAKFIGVPHAVTVNSCASALFLAVKALGITGEVLLPSFTFAASANAIETAGATPVFVDINERTFNIDVKKLGRAITKKTQAIMPVHIAGLPADMPAIMRIARRHKLFVIEDSAETEGGTVRGKQAGGFGVGCFSFFPTKNMTTGEGGMVTTHDAALAQKIRTLAAHGMAKDTHLRAREKKEVRAAIMPGYNMRMSNLLAAIGVEQVKKLRQMNILRRRHAAYLTKRLRGLPIITPNEPKGFRHVYQMYIIRVGHALRDALLASLKEAGIGATVFSDPPVHEQSYYRARYGKRYTHTLPVTETVAKENIVLPLYPQMTRRDLDYVVTHITRFFKHL